MPPIVPGPPSGRRPGACYPSRLRRAGRATRSPARRRSRTSRSCTGRLRAYSQPRQTRRRLEVRVLALIGILLLVWLAITIIGAVIKGLFWLAVVGLIFFLITAAFGWGKRNTRV